MNLFIRADSNPEIGTGHIMRCLSIVKAAEKQGLSCTFITADHNSDELLQKNGLTPICLDSTWNNLNLETEKLIKLIEEKQIKRLLIDTYFVTYEYLSKIKGKTKTIYIDDLNAFIYPCDVLINYSIYWDKFDYVNIYPKSTKFLLGCEYTPLREQFMHLPEKKISEKIENILIMTGGTDNYNVSCNILEAFSKINNFKHLRFNVICGSFNINREKLLEFEKRFLNVRILESVENIAPLMCEADLAISAAGTTLYELYACGTLTICFTLADNQLDNAKGFDEKGLMIYAGDVRNDRDKIIYNIISSYYKLNYMKYNGNNFMKKYNGTAKIVDFIKAL